MKFSPCLSVCNFSAKQLPWKTNQDWLIMARSLVATLLFLTLFLIGDSEAAQCLNGSCHANLVKSKYLHGPVAAELAGAKGCVACHIPAGRICSKGKKGAFKPMLKSVRMCQVCHTSGTGTQHSNQNLDCLRCHDPHGSNKSSSLNR